MGLMKCLFVLFVAGVILLFLLVTYPFWLLFVKVVNFIGVKNIRSIDGKLQIPVVFYEHPVTKRVVVFVAAIHIAEPTYYVAIQELIDSLKGYHVLFEGTGKLSPQEEQSLTPKEKEIASQFDFIFDLTKMFGELMSLQYQKNGLTYPVSWINTDMRLYDLIRAFVQRDLYLVKRGWEVEDPFTEEFEQNIARWLIDKIFNRLVPVATILAVGTLFSRNMRGEKRLILDARNEIAFQGIDQYLKDGNIVTIWGAAHLPGIEKCLKKSGFREVRREWFTAYTVRNYSLLETFKKGVSASKKVASAATALKKD